MSNTPLNQYTHGQKQNKLTQTKPVNIHHLSEKKKNFSIKEF